MTRDSSTFVSLLEPGSEFLPVPRASESFIARVFSRVDMSGDCWVWTGTLDQNGYGILGRGPRGAGNIAAHRAVYELMIGSIPEDMCYDHLCRNPPCVNPDHGEIVTPEENKRRGFGVGILYAQRVECGYGHPLDGVTRRKGKPSHRYCKTCKRISSGEYYHRKRAEREQEQH